jgi:hypothetical protein
MRGYLGQLSIYEFNGSDSNSGNGQRHFQYHMKVEMVCISVQLHDRYMWAETESVGTVTTPRCVRQGEINALFPQA